MRNLFLALLLTFAWAAFFLPVETVPAQAGDPWSLIAEVNALRASYGLAPYEVDSALMGAAQAQSEWQAQLGTWSHSGPGGSRPYDRAVAFGYGKGAQIYVSENVAMGIDTSPQTVVYEMWQDSIHLETMISSRYRHIGAGVAVQDGWVYYTIVVGYVAGSAGTGSNATATPGAASTPAPAGTPLPTNPPFEPVQLATAAPDGSITHVVGAGQTLWSIAATYKVGLPDLLAYNGLTETSLIYPGDKLTIRPASVSSASGTATVSATNVRGTPEATGSTTPATASPTRTSRPSRTPTSQDAAGAAALSTGAALTPGAPTPGAARGLAPGAADEASRSRPDYLLYVIIFLGISGVALIGLGSVLKRPAPASPPEPAPEDPL